MTLRALLVTVLAALALCACDDPLRGYEWHYCRATPDGGACDPGLVCDDKSTERLGLYLVTTRFECVRPDVLAERLKH